jgi:hypothetical protein
VSSPVISAAIIPVDFIDRNVNGKFILHGIYTNAYTFSDELVLSIRVYIRMRFERLGKFPCKLQFSDRSHAPNMPPGFEVTFEANVTEDNMHACEAAIEFPQLHVQTPVPASMRGSPVKRAFLITLLCDGEIVESHNFDTIFAVPPAQARML